MCIDTRVGDRNLQRAVRHLLHPFPLFPLHLLPHHHSANATPHLLVHTNHWQCFYAKKQKKRKCTSSASVYILTNLWPMHKNSSIVVTKVRIRKYFQSSLLQTIMYRYFHLTFSNKGLNLSANSHSRAWTLS